MQIGKKIFPYPVINNAKDFSNFENSSYSLSYDYVEDDMRYFKLNNVRIKTDNINIISMLKKGELEGMLIVESTTTIFRKVFKISEEPIDVSIPITNLNDKVEVSAYIYATRNISDYKDKDFLEAYEDYVFNINKYNVVAIDDGYTEKIVFDEEIDDKVSSIFLVISNKNELDKELKVRLEDKQIHIYMPYKQFEIYDKLKGLDNLTNIWFALITIPVLTSVLKELQKTNSNIDDILFDYSWFYSIKEAYKKNYDKELTTDLFLNLDTFVFSQKIMNSSSTKAIYDTYNLLIKDKNDDMEGAEHYE